jgi:hypothetical protein
MLRRHSVPVLACLALSLAAGGFATSPTVASTSDGAAPVGERVPAPRPPVAARVQPTVAHVAAGNPLAGRRWGVYKGPAEMAWAPYVRATGTNKKLLARIALRPKAKWFGSWISNGSIASKVHEYISNSQAGDRTALVQMTVFRMEPWEHDACHRLPTRAEQASYKQWTNRFAAAVGSTPAAIVLQPDGPFALCAPGGSTLPSSLVAYSARVFSALPHTSVYVEAGSADWPAAGGQGGVNAAVKILVRGGVRYARGFALNGTHYSDTNLEVARGAAIVRALASRGLTGKHFVVNTAENGHPFTFGSYTGSDPNNAFVCASRTEPRARTCVTLGIPPTTDVANAAWRISATTRTLARRYVDAYLWFGRPWLYRQASPFVLSRALQLVRTSPY